MDYIGWVISIYDEYYKRYTKDKNKKHMSKEDIKSLLIVLFSIFFTIMICILTYYDIFNKIILNFLMVIIFLFLYIYMWKRYYKKEDSIYKYDEKLIILRSVLIEMDLYSKKVIEKLYNDTKGFEVKNKVIINSSILIALLQILIQIENIIIISKLISIIIVFSSLIGIVYIFYYLYFYFAPNSRIRKKREFNKILNIMLVRDSIRIDNLK